MSLYEKIHTNLEEYYANVNDYENNNPSVRTQLKFPEPSFSVAIVIQPKYAERLASCWNACLQLDDPEKDIPKLIEALKAGRDLAKDDLYQHPDDEVAKEQSKLINEALSLVKTE